MILKSIKLHNYRQHKDRVVDFDGNLIAVIGHNGCGKSNFLGSIQFALTGEQPGFNKSDLLSWGESEGFVELVFTHQGTDYKINRSINSSSVTLTVNGSTISGAKKVEEQLNSVIGTDKQLFQQAVFVRQSEVDSILFTDPKARELSFQKLLGIGDAAKINRQLGEILSNLEPSDNFDESIEATKTNLAGIEENFKKFSEEKEKVEAILATLPKKEEIQAAYDSALEEKSKLEKQLKDFAKSEDCKSRIERFTKELEKYKNDDDAGKLSEDLRIQYEADAILKEYKTVSKEVENYKGCIDFEASKETKTSEELQAMREEIETMSSVLNNSKGQISALSKLDNAFGDLTGVCPLCGSHVDHDLHADIHEKIQQASCPFTEQDILQKKEILSGEETAANYKKQKIASYEATLREKQSRLSELERTISEKGIDVNTNYGHLAYDTSERLRKLNSDKNAYNSILTTIDLSRSEMTRLALSDLPKPVLQKSYDDACMRLSNVSEAMSSYTELVKMQAQYVGQIESVKITLSETKSLLDDLVAKKKLSDKKIQRIDVLRRVRDWFNYKNGPHSLSLSVMEALNLGVNRFLDVFSAPFTVEPATEGIGFKCRFTDGRKMPEELPDASSLSGGQKIQLAVAFRFATYCLFANKLGLMSLDEPTAYLDDANVGRFGDLLQKIKEIAKNMDLQVLIATHEKAVMPYADSILDFSD